MRLSRGLVVDKAVRRFLRARYARAAEARLSTHVSPPKQPLRQSHEMTAAKAKIKLKRVGEFLIVTSLILAIIYPLCHRQIIQFLTIYGSPDHRITANGEREIISAYYFGIVVLLGAGLSGFKSYDPVWSSKARLVFTRDHLCPDGQWQLSPGLALPFSSLVALALIASMRITPHFPRVFLLLYAKDHGVLDILVPISMVIAAVLLGSAAWSLRKAFIGRKSPVTLLAVYLFLTSTFVFIAGEEISWGQDFFRWPAIGIFSHNPERQTNLHNFFNPYFDYGYIPLALVFVIVGVSAWLELNDRWHPWNQWLLPHPSLIGLSFAIAFVAIVWYPEQELLEELIAAFTLFYSYRIFACVHCRKSLITL